MDASAKISASVLGVADVKLLELPDNRLDSLDRLDLINLISEHLIYCQSDCVYIHHSADVNFDHPHLHETVVTGCLSRSGQTVKRFLCYEAACSNEWQPTGSVPSSQLNWVVHNSDDLPRKREALNIYSQEMRPEPHAQSFHIIEHCACLRCS